MKAAVERRRFRRVSLDVPVAIRSLDHSEPPTETTAQVRDISLAGVYCVAKSPCPLQPGESVVCSVSVPPADARAFPFSRVMGKGWVVRVQPLLAGRREGDTTDEESVLGVAVAFTRNVTALGHMKSY